MSPSTIDMRALLVGVERYTQPEIAERPGTLQALREAEHRFKSGGWKTRLLSNDASTTVARSGLTQILEGLEWLREADQGLVLISAEIKERRLYPIDYKPSFVAQSTLALADLLGALTPQTGLILDGAAPLELTQPLTWSIVASADEVKSPLFSAYGPTDFLHSIVVALNTWPAHEELKVKGFFERYRDSGAPESAYHNYSSLESISLLTPLPLSIARSIGATMSPTPNSDAEPNADPNADPNLAATTVPRAEDTLSNPSGADLDLSRDSSLSGESLSSSVEARGGRFLARGRFQLLRILGEGGIGQVFLARDARLKQMRAIKLLKLPDQLSEQQRDHIRKRMLQSVRAAQELSAHTHHVVQVYETDVDEDTELPFIVMEHLKGITLNQRIYERPRLTLDQIFDISLTLCETLAIAHKHNVIHRDLKPENVMLITRGDDDLFVKLLDFDLVKMESSEVKTQEGQILGTLEYMSPEQLKGLEIDARADVFSLGAILYECLSGVRANPGKNQRELVRTLLDRGVKPLEEVAPQLPKPICALVNRSLSLNPLDRPQDAGELLRALRPLQRFKSALSRMSLFADGEGSDVELKALIRGGAADLESSEPSEPSEPAESTLDDLQGDGRSYADLQPTLSAPVEAVTEPHQLSKRVEASPANTAVSSSSARWPLIIGGIAMIGAMTAITLKLTDRTTQPTSAQQGSHQQGSHQQGSSQQGSSQQGSSQQGSPQQGSPQQGSSQQGSSQQGWPQVKLRALAPLKLLPTPSARWTELEVSSQAHPSLGALRIYRGGRLEDRLAQLTHDLHFGWRTGDPPLEAWRESAALRWRLLQLAPRDVISELTLDSRAAISIPQSVYLEQIARRPERERHAKLAEVIKTTMGLVVLNVLGRSCAQLESGDVITEMSWRVPKQRRLNGSCERAECLNAHTSALKRKRSMMRVRLRLKVTRDVYERRQWSTRELSLQCTLR